MIAVASPIQPLSHTDPTATAATILLASDGDTAMVDALCAAARVAAAALGGAPAVIGVSESLPGVIASLGDVMPAPVALDETRRLALHADLARAMSIAAAGDSAWPIETHTGTPSRVLADQAARHHAALLVMGLGRRNPLDRLFGTETTLATLRASSVPLLAVPPDFSGAPLHAVVGLDFSGASVAAAQLAQRILARGGRLTLVHVRPRFTDPSPDWQAWDADYSRTLPPLLVKVREQLASRDDITVESTTVRGDPAPALLAFAHSAGADLIAVGTQRHSLLERIVVGSVASRVLRASRSAVLAVPAVHTATG